MRTHSSRLAVLALALATVFTGLSAPAADAGVPGSKPITGIPGRNASGPVNPGGNTQCVDGAGYLNGKFIYHDPYSRCEGTAPRVSAGVGGVWFEVWRFYGTEANPAQAWTVSRLNQPEWDNPSYAYAVFAPHPDDAGVATTPSAGPWEAYQSAAGGGARLFSPSGDQRKSPGNTVVSKLRVNGKPVLATDTPFRSHGSCASVETDDSMIADFFDPSHPDYGDESAANFRKYFYETFVDVKATSNTEVALATINARGSRSRGAGQSPVNSDDILYDDRIACSSGFDFVVPEVQAPKRFTTCWVPVEMRYLMKVRPDGSLHRDFTVSGGPRYHTETYPNQSGDGYGKVRDIIEQEVRTRNGNDVLTPAQPYGDFVSSSQPARDAAAAAKSARNHAQCTHGTGSVHTEAGQGGEQGATPDRLEVKITQGPKKFVHVGGQLDPARWTAVSGNLLCGGKPCGGDLAPELVSLSYTLRIRGTNGYSPCSGGRTSCDFDVEMDQAKTRRTRPHKGGGGTVTTQASGTGYFYRATTGSQRVKVEIVNARGTYRTYRRVEYSSGACNTSIVTIWDGDGSEGAPPQPCRRWTEIEYDTHSFSPTVNGNRTLRVTGSVGRR